VVLRPFSLSCLDFSCTGTREAEAPGALASVPTPIAQVFTTRVHSRSTPPDHASRAPRREHGAWVGRPRGQSRGLLANGRTTEKNSIRITKAVQWLTTLTQTRPHGATHCCLFCAGEKKGKEQTQGKARPVPALLEDSSRLRSSGGLPIALHRCVAVSRPAATLQAGAAAWGLAAAAAGRVTTRRRAGEA